MPAVLRRYEQEHPVSDGSHESSRMAIMALPYHVNSFSLGTSYLTSTCNFQRDLYQSLCKSAYLMIQALRGRPEMLRNSSRNFQLS